MLPSRSLRILALWITLAIPAIALGQAYPNRTIRIIATEVGGSGDLISRQIAQNISVPLGQSVVVENRGTDIVPAAYVANVPPDGYTILVAAGALWLNQFMSEVPFDPIRDFAPISLAVITSSVLIVSPSLPVNSVKELIAYVKSQPGKLNYGSTGSGSSYHLMGELFKQMTGTDILRVRYKASSQAFTDLISNRIHLIFATAPAAMPHVRSGKVKALGVTTLQPSALAPGLEPIALSGLPGFEHTTKLGVFAPAKTPDPVIRLLYREISQFIKSPEAQKRLLNMGMEGVGGTPEEMSAIMKAEMAKWGKVIKDANIKPD